MLWQNLRPSLKWVHKMTNKEMYQEIILDHYRNPQNFGKLENADIVHKEANTLCGDVIEVQLKLNEEKKISSAKFIGEGCAISQSSADILLDNIRGKDIADINKLDKDFILSLLGIEISFVRLKCALLPLVALKGAIAKMR